LTYRRGDGRERAPILHLELAKERGNMALDRTNRNEQSRGDLGVGQMFSDRTQHFRLAG
jgi:hypothetical protein